MRLTHFYSVRPKRLTVVGKCRLLAGRLPENLYFGSVEAMPWTWPTALAATAASLPLLFWGLSTLASHPGGRFARVGSLLSMGLSLVMTLVLWIAVRPDQSFSSRATWLAIGDDGTGLILQVGLQLDFLALAMLSLVAFIVLLVQVFSFSYLQGDSGYGRYFAFLGFFSSAMMWLVLADNLLMLFVCWELVGLASYLLIGFWREKAGPARAAQKAFLFNRVGDAGFLIAILILISGTGTLNLAELPGRMISLRPTWHLLAGLGLFLGAAGKSAQGPLSGWLPDAMEGPTPVSSLIHAATMVAAGVYLLARSAPLLRPEVGTVVAFIGAGTALWAAIQALKQWDIKRVLAFSTISQLGYMVMGIGVGARDVALLHLFTHAFFKCALFLSAGAVIHAVGTQDLRQMGQLRLRLPRVFWSYLPPMLALAGLPLFSGFLSKDGILLGAISWAYEGESWQWLVPAAGFAAAGLTAFYMGRHAWLIFFAPDRTQQPLHRPDARMWIPLSILAFGSFWLPFGLNPLLAEASWLLQGWAEPAPTPSLGHGWVVTTSIAVAMGGLAVAWWRREHFSPPHPVAAEPDEEKSRGFFDRWLGLPLLQFSAFLQLIDRRAIDGAIHTFAWLAVHKGKSPSLASLVAAMDDVVIDGIVNGFARLVRATGRGLRNTHTGRVQWTLWIGLLFLALILVWVIW